MVGKTSDCSVAVWKAVVFGELNNVGKVVGTFMNVHKVVLLAGAFDVTRAMVPLKEALNVGNLVDAFVDVVWIILLFDGGMVGSVVIASMVLG